MPEIDKFEMPPVAVVRLHLEPVLQELSLPVRLLSFGEEPDNQIKLVTSVGSTSQKPYAALSHCWGKHQPLRTTTSNISQMMQEIEWSILPAVFQDAIKVCRRLDIKLLWIDSLCIIQDDTRDWEVESAQMANYYEHARITIYAASSVDSSQPFLRDRAKRWLPRRFELLDAANPQYSIIAREYPRYEMPEDSERLNTRAWAWQEAVLSTRIIVYGQSGITWVCKSGTTAEDGTTGQRTDGASMALGVLGAAGTPGTWESIIHSPVLASENEEDTQALVESWWRLIRSFSNRALAYPTDRLPAMSGVASRIKPRLSGGYLAGLWRKHLVESLCWIRAPPEVDELPYASTEYVAPSWSWASITSGVYHGPSSIKNFVSKVDILEASCFVPGLNELGKVSSGQLVLKGKTTKIFLTNKNPLIWVGYHLEDRKHSSRSQDVTRDGELVHIDCVLTMISKNHRICRAQDDKQGRRRLSGMICALLLGEDYPPKESDDGKRTEYVMLLGQSEDEEAFHRLGIVAMNDDRLFQGAKEELVRIV
ncbi:HET-domain-containing protein [Microthyrium microscopicum]|uniref:HET-domain-containing protein n=1 Tax=Microthyrium microscopicum TaxID=703497 RepID=A0A6A6U2J0_9PEZI|nr:HET-domain-containing protein [Microthyrium microscopicum]